MDLYATSSTPKHVMELETSNKSIHYKTKITDVDGAGREITVLKTLENQAPGSSCGLINLAATGNDGPVSVNGKFVAFAKKGTKTSQNKFIATDGKEYTWLKQELKDSKGQIVAVFQNGMPSTSPHGFVPGVLKIMAEAVPIVDEIVVTFYYIVRTGAGRGGIGASIANGMMHVLGASWI